MVKIERTPNLTEDVEVSIEGLPPGWKGSTALALGSTKERPVIAHGHRVLLTITAPADAAIGTIAPFHVIGRVTTGEKTIQRTAQPLTMYMSGDRQQYRPTPQARAAVAQWSGPWLSTEVEELTVASGATVELPIDVHQIGDAKTLPVVPNLATNGVKCNFGSPQTLAVRDGKLIVPIKPAESLPLGTHGICVALGWGSDYRVGMPGPCTRLVKLHVVR
jgi:hypothetical protein